MSGEKKLNPRSVDVTIGIRAPRKIKIYPLSVADELELTDIIKVAVTTFYEGQNKENAVFIGELVDLVKPNIKKILGMLVEEPVEDILADMTLDQLVNILEIVYKNNFEELIKKGRNLFKMLEQVPLDLER